MNIDDLEKRIDKSIKFVAFFAAIVPTAYLIWFWLINPTPISLSGEDWGQLGDFIGGILNPVIAFSAFYWLANSVRLQKIELSEMRNALVEAKDAQVKQAEIQLAAARLSGLNSLLNSTNSDIQNFRHNIEFMCSQIMGKQHVVDLDGNIITLADARKRITSIRENLEDLINHQVQLESGIREMINAGKLTQ